jgi:hypothetical protein
MTNVAIRCLSTKLRMWNVLIRVISVICTIRDLRSKNVEPYYKLRPIITQRSTVILLFLVVIKTNRPAGASPYLFNDFFCTAAGRFNPWFSPWIKYCWQAFKTNR